MTLISKVVSTKQFLFRTTARVGHMYNPKSYTLYQPLVTNLLGSFSVSQGEGEWSCQE